LAFGVWCLVFGVWCLVFGVLEVCTQLLLHEGAEGIHYKAMSLVEITNQADPTPNSKHQTIELTSKPKRSIIAF